MPHTIDDPAPKLTAEQRLAVINRVIAGIDPSHETGWLAIAVCRTVDGLDWPCLPCWRAVRWSVPFDGWANGSRDLDCGHPTWNTQPG